MLKTLTAYTLEVDDEEQAVSEILEQLDLENNLLQNSLGIITCYADFLDTGVVRTLCERLPFDVIGTTPMGSGIDKADGLVILTLCVLTSDDVTFSTTHTEPLLEEQQPHIANAYHRAVKDLPEQPALMLLSAPLLNHVGAERIIQHLDAASGGVPIFGTLTSDHYFDFHASHTIHNGMHYRDRLVMALFSGPVQPKFLIVSTPEENVSKQIATITASEGNIVQEVNGMPVLDYLKSVGLTHDGGLEGTKSIPILLNYNDGTPPVARCFYMITPEGYAVCGGEMPIHATFAIGTMDDSDILRSAGELLERALREEACHAMLIVSCIVRSISLGMDQMAEAAKVRSIIGGQVPYHLCYSGGEICPVYTKCGATANRFHNFSFVVCMLTDATPA